jgi:hypothetical protein
MEIFVLLASSVDTIDLRSDSGRSYFGITLKIDAHIGTDFIDTINHEPWTWRHPLIRTGHAG